MAIKGQRPFFVIGYERSGTTLLMAMLGNHPRLAVPEVGWLFPRIYPWRHTYGDLSVDANLWTMASEMLFGLNQPLWGMKLNPATAVDEILAHAPERSFAGVYCAMHLRYAKEVGNKPRWGQKTPNNLYFVPQILDNFPDAQFICITRDGLDCSALSLDAAFGAGHIYMAAHTWNAAQVFVRPFAERYGAKVYHDIRYEELVREPARVLKGVCDFLGETYSPSMIEYHQQPAAQARGKQRDHALLAQAPTDVHIGIYKQYLSLWEQRIFAAVAGETQKALGYKLPVEPIEISEADRKLYIEWDGRYRVARLDGPGGHIVFESYRDWLVEQRELRRQKGLWSEKNAPKEFPIGHPDEEAIVGYRAWKRWKEHFSIKRQYHR